jgi:hypothetical protein
MRKNIIILFSVVVIIAISGIVFVFNTNPHNKNLQIQTKDLSSVSEQEIVKILKTNTDVQQYMQKFSDFTIKSKEILTKESILAGQAGQVFQALYYGLDLENNRYMKVELMNVAGSNGFITAIDFKNNSVPKAFGILLLQASAGAIQNGQISIPAENK